VHQRDALAHRAAGGQDVVHDEDAGSGRERLAPPENTDTLLRLRIARLDSQAAGDVVGEDDSGRGGAEDDLYAVVGKAAGDLVAHRLQEARVLGEPELFQILAAVQPGRELEVAGQKRPGLLKEGKRLFIGHKTAS